VLLNKFRVTLIGRNNVGKSTLFNRISKSREAITSDKPGVTRDFREKRVDIWGKSIFLIDTPGMFDKTNNDHPELIKAINEKMDDVIKSSNLIIFVIDGVTGISPNDFEIAKVLRKSDKDVIVVINKSETQKAESVHIDALELGFGDIVRVSAEHGNGMSDFFELIDKYLPENLYFEDEEDKKEEIIKLAIIGRPNVGKSTMINTILGTNKQLVADFAGVTKESSESIFEFKGRKLNIIDTPGIRRHAKVHDVLEKISVYNSRNSYKQADATILVIDAESLEHGKIEKQDLVLASNIIEEEKPLVIAFNKYDKTPYKKNDIPSFLKYAFATRLSQLKEVPFLFVSALKNENIEKMMDMLLSIYDKQKKKIKTSTLNEWLHEINKTNLLKGGIVRFKLKYITQIGILPPRFLIFMANKENMRLDQERYIMNSLKRCFNLGDTAVSVIFKESSVKKRKNV
jgi:GTP-binding protein